MRCATLEDAVRIRDRAAGIVVSVELDVALDMVTQLCREGIAPSRRGDAYGVRHTDAVHAHSVHRGVDLEEVTLGRTEAVLAREPDLHAVVLDELDDRARLADDVVDTLAVRELTQVRRGAEQNVDARDTGLHRDARVVHVTAHVREHLRSEPQAGDDLQVLAGLRGRDGRRELDVLDAEFVEHLGDLYLLGGREMRVGELLALAERRVDDREALDRHRHVHFPARRSAPSGFIKEARQRIRAHRASPQAWSHGSASTRGHPRADSPSPSGGRASR